jgi:hypothetical protein
MTFSSDPLDILRLQLAVSICSSYSSTLLISSANQIIIIVAYGLTGPVGFDPTATGSGGLRFLSKGTAPYPDWATGPTCEFKSSLI